MENCSCAIALWFVFNVNELKIITVTTIIVKDIVIQNKKLKEIVFIHCKI